MNEEPWFKNLQKALLLDPLVALHGNVRDQFFVRPELQSKIPAKLGETHYVNFPTWLALELEAKGFELIVFYDALDEAVVLRPEMVRLFEQAATAPRGEGATAAPDSAGRSPLLPSATGPTAPSSASETPQWMVKIQQGMEPETFVRTLHDRIFQVAELSCVVIFQFTDRYLSFSDRQDGAERRLSMLLQKTAMSLPTNLNPRKLQSRLLLLFDVEGAVPQELGSQAPFAGSARIPIPSMQDRERFFRSNCRYFHSEPGNPIDVVKDSGQLTLCAGLSDGLRTQDLLSLVALSRQEQLGLGKDQFRTLLDRFRFGTRENAWLKIKKETLSNAADFLTSRVKGQDAVIADVVPTLIRAKLGLSEISGQTESAKPRGVFFFVGPTGVGKTELSKAIAALLFADENAMIRFDMSEYSEEHQQARLVGAPPGYIGFDQGGQLPNAILEQPFSVVLFDEIEKAHGRILDKFLQILDDGRLTDGMGRTVYFSEAIIIFTSNIGTAPRIRSAAGDDLRSAALQASGLTDDLYVNLQELEYEDLQKHFRSAVKDFFVSHLGRPEILNRIGEENVLVFNFLNNEDVKDQIIQKQVDHLGQCLSANFGVSVRLTTAFREVLKQHPNGFKRNGARGVRNLLGKMVLDRVATDVFALGDDLRGRELRVDYNAKQDEIKDGFHFERSKLKYIWSQS